MKTQPKLTEKEALFLDHLSDPSLNGNIREAMNRAGYSSSTSINQIIKQLSNEITEVARHMIAGTAVKSVLALEGIIDSKGGGMNGSNIIKAAGTLLDRAGLHKKEESINLDVGKGVVILPAKTIQVIEDPLKEEDES